MEDDYSEDYSDDFATFGDRIVNAREALGLSQNQLSRRLGVQEETLADWESDRNEPRANKLQMLAGVLNVSLVWLMSGEGDGSPAALEDEQIDAEVLLSELRGIRAEQARLAERSARLEKRLRAYLIG
ncbi:MAG: helix-turn-helix domain-containing protein [Pseudomonadota bacterium]